MKKRRQTSSDSDDSPEKPQKSKVHPFTCWKQRKLGIKLPGHLQRADLAVNATLWMLYMHGVLVEPKVLLQERKQKSKRHKHKRQQGTSSDR